MGKRQNDIKYIAEHYGFKLQCRQCIEEMGELTTALCKVERANTHESKTAAINNMLEEIADVYIMIAQLKLLCGETLVEKIIDKKLKRQLERIENEKGTC